MKVRQRQAVHKTAIDREKERYSQTQKHTDKHINIQTEKNREKREKIGIKRHKQTKRQKELFSCVIKYMQKFNINCFSFIVQICYVEVKKQDNVL